MGCVFHKTKKRVEEAMSIQKKSLISTLKTAKKANVASDAKGEKIASMRVPFAKAAVSAKASVSAKTVGTAKMSFKSVKSTKAASLKSAKAATLKVAL
jgi:hypothetical protein